MSNVSLELYEGGASSPYGRVVLPAGTILQAQAYWVICAAGAAQRLANCNQALSQRTLIFEDIDVTSIQLERSWSDVLQKKVMNTIQFLEDEIKNMNNASGRFGRGATSGVWRPDVAQ